MDIKPIETVYNGYRFRSRLEARWAVFFDQLELKWEYEAEGYDIDGVWYLPDFVITEGHGATPYWCEIKPTLDQAEEGRSKYRKLSLEQPGFVLVGYPKLPKIGPAPLWGIREGAFAISYGKPADDERSRKYAEEHGMRDPRPFIWQERNRDGSVTLWPYPAFEFCEPDEYPAVVGFLQHPDAPDHPIPVHLPLTTKKHDSLQLRLAYEAAQQARFEHGEKPNGHTRRSR
jgi:hypothetical protein